jgi:glycosyltransferase involved in cell wall biosynthesis
MPEGPLITCIVPTYNAVGYLGESLESILAQDYRPLEVIVVDDGSTDHTAELAESYGPPVRVVVQETNLGPSATRNRGLREARGEYLTFLDADDLYRPGKLTRQLQVLEADPEIDICLCVAENFWEPGLEQERDRYIAAGRIRMTHHLSTLLTTRSVFDRVGPLDEETLGDHADWFLRAIDLGLRIEILDEVLLFRRMHAASLSHNRPIFDDYFKLLRGRIDQRRR